MLKAFLGVSCAVFFVICSLIILLGLNTEQAVHTTNNQVVKNNNNQPKEPITIIHDNNTNVYYKECTDNSEDLKIEIQDIKNENGLLIEQIEQLEQELNELLSKSELVNDVDQITWIKRKGRSRVVIAGFPATGVDVIRRLITKITKQPTFSVYTEETNFVENTGIDTNELSVWSNCWKVDQCHLTPNFPIIVKTFFPAVVMQSTVPEYDRIIHVVRNPYDTIESFYRMCQVVPWLASRKRAFEFHVKKEISEYKKFYDYWRRQQEENQVPMIIVRYEDLCVHMKNTIRHILSFLDISYLVTDEEIDSVLETEICDPALHIGRILDEYSLEQYKSIKSDLSTVLNLMEYDELMKMFDRNFS